VDLRALKFRTPDGEAKLAEIFRGVDAITVVRNLQSAIDLGVVVQQHGNAG
jgi:hypothetical protein